MPVIVSRSVQLKLRELVTILYDENYFGLFDNAVAYVQGIYNFINSIPRQAIRPIKNTKPVFYYCQYRPNKRTTWYIIYEMEGED